MLLLDHFHGRNRLRSDGERSLRHPLVFEASYFVELLLEVDLVGHLIRVVKRSTDRARFVVFCGQRALVSRSVQLELLHELWIVVRHESVHYRRINQRSLPSSLGRQIAVEEYVLRRISHLRQLVMEWY